MYILNSGHSNDAFTINFRFWANWSIVCFAMIMNALLGSVFNIIICSLWLAIPDEMLGRFIAVIYLIINLSAGWGTFPSFMQNKFLMFYHISHHSVMAYIILEQ